MSKNYYRVLIVTVFLLALVGAFGLGVWYENAQISIKEKEESIENDYRTSPTELTSHDAAKYLASKFIPENSVEGIRFRLEKANEINNWVSFYVIPTNVETDTVKIYLSNNDGTWTVRGFGSLPPFEEPDFPEGL